MLLPSLLSAQTYHIDGFIKDSFTKEDIDSVKVTMMTMDILGNLSNVDAGIDSRSRWEYYTNVIPRYVMLRLVYRFDKQQKKKGMNVYKTCCSNHGMKIGDIGGMGEFTPDGYRKRYYIIRCRDKQRDYALATTLHDGGG